MKIDIEKFEEQYRKEYKFLYDHDNVAGEQEAAEAFDKFAPKHREFIGEFCKYIGDFITSDREAAAFMFALEKFEMEGLA